MAKKVLYSFDRVEIEWVDSIGGSGWTDLSDVMKEFLDDEKLLYHKSIGYFLAETDKMILLTMSRSTNLDDIKVDARLWIPKCAIINMKTL